MAQAILDTPSNATLEAQTQSETTLPVLVIGGGPCGMRVAQKLAQAGRNTVVLNAEKWDPYNRVKLTPLLAGDVQLGDVAMAPGPETQERLEVVNGLKAVGIDLAKRLVTTQDGRQWGYSSLVLAMGSRAFVPSIPGADRPGVYQFRDASDVEALIARSFRARSVVVIGGGLLGLEAARGMHRRGAQVTVIEHEDRLMPRQLDQRAAELLRERIAGLGVRVETRARVASIDAENPNEEAGAVSGVTLGDKRQIDADTVIICTGVRANIEMAREAGLLVGRGVLVNDQMRSSAFGVYAVGECAEHRGAVYGLVGPGLEQADAAAAVISGDPASYQGSTPATKLKVIGAEVFSIGDVEDLEERRNVVSRVFDDPAAALYRRVFIERGKLVGAIAVGDWPDASRVQEAALEGRRVFPWMLRRFEKEGVLWGDEPAGAAALPAQAIVCNCTGVTAGRIRDAITLGAASAPEITAATGASSVCGSCAPKIEELLSGGGAPPKPVRLHKSLLWISGIAAVLAMATLLLPRIPLPDAYLESRDIEALWFDSVVKQWTGYTLAGLSLAAALIGLRKRVAFLRRLGGYDWWRVTHLIIGALCAIGLFAHTGFRLGSGLNAALMIFFVAAMLAGALAGVFTGGEHVLRARRLATAERSPRTPSLWAHVLLLWPLPALLALHVLSVYVY